MNAFRAVVRVLILGVLLATIGPAAAQQTYPNKPIRLIVTLAAGGTNSIVARIVSQNLTESWGQPVIVDHRPGGNTIIGTEIVAKAAPDGYTILFAGISHIITPLLFPTPYDAIKDFAPVATFASGSLILALNVSVPANNLQEFIALAKSKPGQLNYATYGSGSMSHLGTELFSEMAGIKMQHIPYKGGAPAIVDLIGGQVQLYLGPVTSLLPHIKGGRVKAVAIARANRSSAVPQVPTFAEAGLPGLDIRVWLGIVAPAGTSNAITHKMSSELAQMMTIPDFKEKFASQGLEPFISDPEQFAALMKADMAMYAKVIKDANIKMEN